MYTRKSLITSALPKVNVHSNLNYFADTRTSGAVRHKVMLGQKKMVKSKINDIRNRLFTGAADAGDEVTLVEYRQVSREYGPHANRMFWILCVWFARSMSKQKETMVWTAINGIKLDFDPAAADEPFVDEEELDVDFAKKRKVELEAELAVVNHTISVDNDIKQLKMRRTEIVRRIKELNDELSHTDDSIANLIGG